MDIGSGVRVVFKQQIVQEEGQINYDVKTCELS